MSTPATDAHAAITNPVVGMLHAIDAQDWNAVRAAFADSVTTAYTSLFGDALVDGGRALRPSAWHEPRMVGALRISRWKPPSKTATGA
jgi:hypothetical protein